MIITSILDLDLYKLTVGEVIFTYFRNIKAKYRMTVRNGEAIKYWAYTYRQLDQEVATLRNLSLKPQELEYLRSLNLFSEEYLKFLSNEPMKNVYVGTAYQNGNGNYPVPEISGDWCSVMLYETFCLSIGNEIFADMYAARNDIPFSAVLSSGKVRLAKKIANLTKVKNAIRDYSHHPLDITEFGTRRRLSKAWQEHVLGELVSNKIVTGTSNVHLARRMNIPVKGTFGHEFPMGMQALSRIQDSQTEAFSLWLKHWKGKLKIALDDTLGDAKFLLDFNRGLAEAYDGLRHDSGPWEEWTNSRLTMYHHHGIDATKKVLFYSDGLDDYAIARIHDHVQKKAIPKYGVGTFFTNDTFLPVPQAVMKIVECNGQPVAKISNNPAKACCDSSEYLRYIKHVSGIKEPKVTS